MSKSKKLETMVTALKARFRLQRLFTVGEKSEDFVLVTDSTEDRVSEMIRARQLLSEAGFTGDVFVYSPTEFKLWQKDARSIPEIAVNEGREIDLS